MHRDETLTRATAADLARRITLDDLYARAGPKQDAESGDWRVRVDWLDSGRQITVDSWDAWVQREDAPGAQ